MTPAIYAALAAVNAALQAQRTQNEEDMPLWAAIILLILIAASIGGTVVLFVMLFLGY